MDIPLSIESIVSGLATAAIIAGGAVVWRRLLRVPILNYFHAT